MDLPLENFAVEIGIALSGLPRETVEEMQRRDPAVKLALKNRGRVLALRLVDGPVLQELIAARVEKQLDTAAAAMSDEYLAQKVRDVARRLAS